MRSRIIIAVAALLLLFSGGNAQAQVTDRPGFINGTLTALSIYVGDDIDSLMKMLDTRPADADSTWFPAYGADGQWIWSQVSISGDTIIAGTDTILVSQIASDTANVRWNLDADTVSTDSMVKTTNLAFFEGDTTFIRNARLGTSGGVGGNVSSATAIAIDVLIPTEDNFATTKFYVDSLLKKAVLYDLFAPADTVDMKEGFAPSSFTKAGEAVVFGEVVYYAADSTWKLADADTVGNQFLKRGIGFIVADISNGSSGTIMTRGVAHNSAWSFDSIGAYVYVSTTPGLVTELPDTTAGNAIQIIGWSIHEKMIIFDPNFPWSLK